MRGDRQEAVSAVREDMGQMYEEPREGERGGGEEPCAGARDQDRREG